MKTLPITSLVNFLEISSLFSVHLIESDESKIVVDPDFDEKWVIQKDNRLVLEYPSNVFKDNISNGTILDKITNFFSSTQTFTQIINNNGTISNSQTVNGITISSKVFEVVIHLPKAAILEYKTSGQASLNLGKLESGNLKFELSGQSKISGNITGNDVLLTIMGQSQFSGYCNTKFLELEQSAQSYAKIEGITESFKATVSGQAKLKAKSFLANDCSINILGQSYAKINSKKISYRVSSMAELKYNKSSDLIYSTKSGFGKVKTY
jgi:hypothetical protein